MDTHFSYQLNTKNKSFLRTYKDLKDRNVKNNKFFLRIYDKDLAYIDPLKARSKDMRLRVIAEIKRNPWYYYREIIRIPVPGGKVRFNLHLGSLATLYCMHNNTSIFLEMPRQQGKTIGIASGFSYITTFGTKNSEILLGNKSGEDAQLNLKRILDIINALPEWLSLTTPSKDTNNVRKFRNDNTNNILKTVPAPANPIRADQIGP